MPMKVFDEKAIRRKVSLTPEAVNVVEQAFCKLASGAVMMPPIMRIDIRDHNGEVDVKSAYIHGEDVFAVKVSSGFFDNHKLGLPSGSGLMVIIDATTGVPRAVLADNGFLTDVRTAAAGAVAARYLAPEHVRAVGVIGAGTQARQQMKALMLERHFKKMLVYAPTRNRIESFAAEMGRELGVEVTICEDAEQVVRGSEVVVTTTPAKSPVVRAEWLHPGLHITAMGSDAEEKNELDPRILAEADVLVCDVKSQCARLGELHHAIASGTVPASEPVTELGAVAAGQAEGRTAASQITVCDLTGTGAQDTAIAAYALAKLNEGG
ncbi:MAG TPA: cyclodeaminase [Bacillales bacterium]|nr:cyclodeaminase [Bacillales bacterium]